MGYISARLPISTISSPVPCHGSRAESPASSSMGADTSSRESLELENKSYNVKQPDTTLLEADETGHDAFSSHFNPFTLYYTNSKLESLYRSELFASASRVFRSLFFGILLLMAVHVSNDYYYYRDDEEVREKKEPVAIAVASLLGVLLLWTLFISARGLPNVCKSHKLNEWNVFIGYAMGHTVIGIFWSLYTVVSNDEARVYTQSSSVICFLVLSHVLGRMVFPVVLLSSWLVTIAYCIFAIAFHWDGEGEQYITQLVFAVLANGFLCYGSYVFEVYRRRSYFLRRRIMSERNRLKEETIELRGEVYNLMLKNFDLTTYEEKTINLQSPVEKAMTILRNITQEHRSSLPQPVFLGLKHVVMYLASSDDIFRPQLEMQLSEKHIELDTDTHAWLFGLIDENAALRRFSSSNLSTVSASVSVSEAIKSTRRRASSTSSLLTNGASSLFPHLPEEEQKQFLTAYDRIETWNFDIFGVDKLTKGRPLLFVAVSLFRKYDLMSKFKISPGTLRNFLSVIEDGYLDNPYHNKNHAADVMQTVHFLLEHGSLGLHLTDIEILAALVASAIHDFDHPGLTNQFHIVTANPKAVIYNDRSVLENHHVSAAFQHLMKDQNNILKNCDSATWAEFRKIVIEMVLATDLGHHFDILAHFKNQVSNAGVNRNAARDRLLLMKMTLKCADVSHTAKNRELHLEWTHRIIEEFFQQGDLEKSKGLPVSPFMDRETPHVARAQVGFINFLVKPMFETFMEYLEMHTDEYPVLRELNSNLRYWEELSEEDESIKSSASATSDLSQVDKKT